MTVPSGTEIVARAAAERPVGFEFLAELERAGMATPVALYIEDPNLALDIIDALARMLGAIHTAVRFHIGDLANYLAVRGGGGEPAVVYERVAELTGMAPQTIENWASVCRKVTRSRRRVELTFSHHDAVRKLQPPEQIEWLEKAAGGGWSSIRIRDELKAAEVLPPPPEQPHWSPEWSQRQQPLTLDGSPMTETAGPGTTNGVPPPTATGAVPIVIADPPFEREKTLRAAVELLLEQAEPMDDDRFYRVPRVRLRELGRLVEE